MDNAHTKQQVRQFYDQVGWQEVSVGLYQNASYEDLRPVSRSYIHRCHLRVNRHLPAKGNFLLDAGCGPIQYPEYLSYSDGYQYRVCVDISIVALQEARKRIHEHGLFVAADVANLPFKADVFDGIVSLHTLHHLSGEDQKKSYFEFQRLMKPGASSVVVNGWKSAGLMNAALPFIRVLERLFKRKKQAPIQAAITTPESGNSAGPAPTGTYVQKLTANSLKEMLAGMDLKILCWRSVSVRFLRTFIHPALLGRLCLRLLFLLEDAFPHFFGEKGQYPLVVLHKAG